MSRAAERVRMQHRIDLTMLGIKAGFDPNQPRNPHTGEWMDTLSGIVGEVDSALSSLADDVLGQMEGLHAWPKGEPIKVTQIKTSDGGWADLKGNEIQVSKGVAAMGGHSEADQALTMAHEMGHMLDHRLRKNHNRFLSDPGGSPGAMQAFVAACVHSSTWETIRQDRYMSEPSELWARAYAQWVRMKAGKNSAIKGEVGRGGHPEGWMWSDEEFVPIAKAVEAVLAEQGLL